MAFVNSRNSKRGKHATQNFKTKHGSSGLLSQKCIVSLARPSFHSKLGFDSNLNQNQQMNIRWKGLALRISNMQTISTNSP